MRKSIAALLGPTRGTIIARSLAILLAVGTLVIITLGLFTPQQALIPAVTNTTTTASTSHTAAVGFAVGDAAPNFTLLTPAGKQVSLSDYRGQIVLLNFWYTTCPGCLAEMPDLEKFYTMQKMHGKHFVILGVNSVDDAESITQFAQQRGLTYPLVLDNQSQVMSLYNLRGTPTSFLLDQQGIVRNTVLGPLDDTTLQQQVASINDR